MTPFHSRTTYVVPYILLMLLLAATVGASFVDWHKHRSEELGVLVALGIATLKATLVILFFMHVKGGPLLPKVVIIVCLSWLGILFTLTLNDYLTRGWEPDTQGWSQQPVIPRP